MIVSININTIGSKSRGHLELNTNVILNRCLKQSPYVHKTIAYYASYIRGTLVRGKRSHVHRVMINAALLMGKY